MKKINKNTLIEFFLLHINILLALPVILKGISNKKKSSVITFSLFMGILGYFFTPYIPEKYDLTQHYIYYESFKYGDFDIFYKGKDIFLPLITLLGNSLGMNPRILSFISAIIFYYFTSRIVIEIIEVKKMSRRKTIFWFILYFLTCPLVYYTVIRYSTALSFFVYGIFLNIKREKKSLLFFLFSIFSHFSMVINIILYYIYKYTFKNIKGVFLYKLCIPLSFLIGRLSIEKILLMGIMKLNSIIPIFNSATYITGTWGNQYYNNLNLIGKIVENFNLLIYAAYSYIFSIRTSKKKLLIYDKIAIYFTTISLLVQNYRTVYYRFQIISVFFFFISILSRSGKKEKNTILVSGFILLILYLRLFDIKNHFLTFLISYSNILKLSFSGIIFDSFI